MGQLLKGIKIRPHFNISKSYTYPEKVNITLFVLEKRQAAFIRAGLLIRIYTEFRGKCVATGHGTCF